MDEESDAGNRTVTGEEELDEKTSAIDSLNLMEIKILLGRIMGDYREQAKNLKEERKK